MKIYIDCEFNDYRGELISMALIDETGREWYEVLRCDDPSDWVYKNVMPLLDKAPIRLWAFQNELERWLEDYDSIHIVADWPEDLQHFCWALITGPGERIDTPPLTMEVVRIETLSDVPHNALADAHAIRKALMLS